VKCYGSSVVPPGDAADEKAQSLGLSWAAPRTPSSFILKEDKPLLRLYESINDRVFGRDAELAEMRAQARADRGRAEGRAAGGGDLLGLLDAQFVQISMPRFL
jgi:hypothetical protein